TVETITILEDDADLRSMMAEMFDVALGLKSVTARSVAQMVEKAPQGLGTRFALLDINLGPEVPTGFAAYDWLRAQHYRGRVVFLTGHADGGALERSRVLGNIEVLQKPMPAEQLIALVSEPGPAP